MKHIIKSKESVLITLLSLLHPWRLYTHLLCRTGGSQWIGEQYRGPHPVNPLTAIIRLGNGM